MEFGEQVFFSAPKKLRSKLCLRWRSGTDLGVVKSSNEQYVGLSNGNMIRLGLCAESLRQVDGQPQQSLMSKGHHPDFAPMVMNISTRRSRQCLSLMLIRTSRSGLSSTTKLKTHGESRQCDLSFASPIETSSCTPKVYYNNRGKELLGGLGAASNRNSKHHV